MYCTPGTDGTLFMKLHVQQQKKHNKYCNFFFLSF